jgi:hypothetical protein
MPSFRAVMQAVSDAWETRRDEVLGQSERLTDAISRAVPQSANLPETAVLEHAYESLAAGFDPINGGFGGPPKFPQQPVLDFLLRIHEERWAPQAASMLKVTLSEMAQGGIHDQLGGGFSRYSVDAQWLVPHFEKMLYDNAQLARLYLWAGIELAEPSFIDVARSTIAYLTTDLRHPAGGFYSAEDADSEGVEGKFYLWTKAELEQVLGPEDGAEAAQFFGASPHGNFEGSNILYRPTSDPWSARTESIRARLLEHRAKRVRPGLDDKVVASWNGLAVRALAEAGAALDDNGYLEAAGETARFVLEEMVVEGVLRRSWRDDLVGSVPGFLEDHASMAQGLFALYAATGENRWYRAAEQLVTAIVERFADPEGGFFDTPTDGEDLIKRPKSQTDNPAPSGNGLAAEALLTLSSYTGDEEMRRLATTTLQAAGLLMERYPSMVGHHLAVLHSHLTGRQLAVVGPDWPRLARVHWDRFRPNVVLAPSPTGEEPIPLFEGRADNSRTLAYLCRDHVCDLPTSDPGDLARQLASEP